MARIVIPERFTFESYREVTAQTNEVPPSDKEMIFDFYKCKYLDSSALGTLLLLRDKHKEKAIKLSNCSGAVKQVIDIANFHKLFQII